jgi:TP901 family phage tail tape measure protein
MSTVLRDLVARLRWDAPLTPLDRFDERVDKSIKQVDLLEGALSRIGAAAAGYFGAQQMMAFGQASIDKSLEFGRAVGQVQAILPNARGRVAELEDQILSLSTSTGKGAVDITNTVNEIVQAYGDSNDTMGIAKTATLGAAAANTTALEVMKLLTATTLAYGDTSLSANKKVMDMAFTARNLGQTTIPEMAQAIGVATPLASALGISLEELFAGIGTLSGVTGSTSEVTTQLRSVMVALLNPTKEMQQALDKVGIKSIKASIAQNGLVGTLKLLKGTTNGSEEAVQKLFGRVEGLNATLQLTGPQMGRFEQQLLAQKSAAGSAVEAYGESAGGANKMGTAMEKADAKIAAAQIGIGKSLVGLQLDWKTTAASIVSSIDKDIIPAIQRMTSSDQSLAPDESGLVTAGKWLVGGGKAMWQATQMTGALMAGVLGAGVAGIEAGITSDDVNEKGRRMNAVWDKMNAFNRERVNDLADIGRSLSVDSTGRDVFTGEQKFTAEQNASARRATGGPGSEGRISSASRAIESSVNNVTMNGDIVVQLDSSQGMTPDQVADAIASRTFRGIARNIPNASEVAP